MYKHTMLIPFLSAIYLLLYFSQSTFVSRAIRAQSLEFAAIRYLRYRREASVAVLWCTTFLIKDKKIGKNAESRN